MARWSLGGILLGSLGAGATTFANSQLALEKEERDKQEKRDILNLADEIAGKREERTLNLKTSAMEKERERLGGVVTEALRAAGGSDRKAADLLLGSGESEAAKMLMDRQRYAEESAARRAAISENAKDRAAAREERTAVALDQHILKNFSNFSFVEDGKTKAVNVSGPMSAVMAKLKTDVPDLDIGQRVQMLNAIKSGAESIYKAGKADSPEDALAKSYAAAFTKRPAAEAVQVSQPSYQQPTAAQPVTQKSTQVKGLGFLEGRRLSYLQSLSNPNAKESAELEDLLGRKNEAGSFWAGRASEADY